MNYFDYMNKTVAEWLKDCGCHDIQPVRVTIGAESWEGCRYKQTNEYTADMDAVKWGQRKAGDKYHRETIYLVGRVPKVYGKPPRSGKSTVSREQKVCFTFEGLDWYVSGYMQAPLTLTDEQKKFHPFGLYFMIAAWDIPNSKIDEYERKPYVRHEMKVETI